jgi:hypothetical protein
MSPTGLPTQTEKNPLKTPDFSQKSPKFFLPEQINHRQLVRYEKN